MSGVPFGKGHGTENDFVLLPDAAGRLELTARRVQALCDRHRGLGADGVLRVVRAGALGEPLAVGIAPDDWFMDYRNGDGSIAEMCGNGVRVFAHYLLRHGMHTSTEFVVGSRSGPRAVQVHAFGDVGDVTVDMGPARALGTSWATVDGVTYTGTVVDVGNPHLVCARPELTPAALAEVDLTTAPVYDPAVFPDGVNVELVSGSADSTVTMRVFERGVGETRSCGTGTVAAAVAALRTDSGSHGAVTVRVPGGQVQVRVSATSSFLRGPSVLVAEGDLDREWWAANA